MEFIYIGIIILLFLHLLFQDGKLSKKHYALIVFAFVFLSSALKSAEHSATGDVERYVEGFKALANVDYSDIVVNYFKGQGKDPIFSLISKFLCTCGFNAWSWLALIAAVFAACFSYIIHRYSTNIFLSCLLLLSIGVFSFTLTGLRQTLALAFILLAYHHIITRNLKGYLLLVGIAFLFHSSAFIFFPTYWLNSYKIGAKQIIIIAISVCLCIFAPTIIRNTLGNIAWNDSIENYQYQKSTLTWSGFIIQASIFAFCFFYRHSVTNDKINILTICLNCMAIGLCLQAMASVIAESFRAAYYYNICSSIAVPIVIASQSKPLDRFIMTSSISLVIFLYMVWTQAYFNYVYFWE